MATKEKTAPEVELNGDAPEDAVDVGEDETLDLMPLATTRRLVKLPTKRKPTGEAFELRTLDDFGIVDQQQLLSWGRRYNQLMASDEDLTEDEQTRLQFTLDATFEKVLNAPKTVKESMPDSNKARIMNAFSAGPLLERQEAQMMIINRLKDKKIVTDEQVEAILVDIRNEVAQRQLSITGN